MSRAPWSVFALAFLAVAVAGCGNGHPSAGSSVAVGNGTTVRKEAVKFAECMRANGVGAFPDPDASGRLTIDGIANEASVDTGSAAFAQALGACKRLEPPGFTGTRVTPRQRTARLAFARCVRDNGVPDFPDPTANGPIVDTNRIPSAATSAGMSILDAAMQKCGQYASAAGVRGSR